jgi:hypothetical protein
MFYCKQFYVCASVGVLIKRKYGSVNQKQFDLASRVKI